MTYRVLKSQIQADFEVAVAAHALEMRNWRAHMASVRADEGKPDLPAIERHVAYPRPSAHPLVEAAVNENDVADYEVVNDDPTPMQVLQSKKNDLLRAVSAAEAAAIAAIVPLGKRRALNLRENDIREADAKLSAELSKQGVIRTIAKATGLSATVDVGAEIDRRRAPEDTKHLLEQVERRRRINETERAAAQAHHDIEDLTLETIDSWQLPDFTI
jgi:hypothetical protein